jgi:hypothetical protein
MFVCSAETDPMTSYLDNHRRLIARSENQRAVPLDAVVLFSDSS